MGLFFTANHFTFQLKPQQKMLNKDWISNVEAYSEEWRLMRLGKFTSSKIHCLMTKKPLTEDSISYINQKVGELLTGQATTSKDDQIDTEDTAWGVVNEPIAMREFARVKNIKFL